MSRRGGPARPARSPGRRHARRSRLWLASATTAFLALAAAVWLLRPARAPYTPGVEAATSDAITRRLERGVPAEAPRIRFTDAAAEAGVAFTHFHGRRSTQLPEDMGSGAAWGDYDGDGDPDLYLVNESGPLGSTPEEIAASPARSALFRNDGGGRFTDVTGAAGVGARGLGMGAAWGDYDGDGDLDLAVSRFGAGLLYRNDGGGRFEDVSRVSGLGEHQGFWTGLSWADYDRDGDLDLYVCGYVQYRPDGEEAGGTSFQYGAVVPFTLNPSAYPPERNLLLRNDGGLFADVAPRAGVDNRSGRSLSASWSDFDEDGWPDLYVANDISDNALFHNRGDGTFEDVSHAAWVGDYRGAMGLGIGDWENDGDLDIFITHWIAQENALYENLTGTMEPAPGAPVRFIDQADVVGLGQVALDFIGWGAGFFDYDNDGRLDLFAVNGSTFQRDDDPALLVPMRNLLFWNAGRERGFFEVGRSSGDGFSVENVGRGAAAADYDGDGDLDLAVVVNGGPARLLRNEGEGAGSWLRVVLRGPRAAGPRGSGGRGRRAATSSFATGAVLRVASGGVSRMRVIGGASSYLGQEPPGEAHVGLGPAARVDLLEVRWPDGTVESFRDLPARATVKIVEGEEPRVDSPGPPQPRR